MFTRLPRVYGAPLKVYSLSVSFMILCFNWHPSSCYTSSRGFYRGFSNVISIRSIFSRVSMDPHFTLFRPAGAQEGFIRPAPARTGPHWCLQKQLEIGAYFPQTRAPDWSSSRLFGRVKHRVLDRTDNRGKSDATAGCATEYESRAHGTLRPRVSTLTHSKRITCVWTSGKRWKTVWSEWSMTWCVLGTGCRSCESKSSSP